jgi:hypothetical protein
LQKLPTPSIFIESAGNSLSGADPFEQSQES